MPIPRVSLTNSELIAQLKILRGNECNAIAEVVLHLAELDARGLYRDAGYSSLFSYCREALGYSEGSAQRRITAARCLQKNPEVYEKLKNGSLSLCQVSTIAPVISEENSTSILHAIEGKSKVEVQRLVAQHSPVKRPTPERIKVKRIEPSSEMPLFSAGEGASKPQERFTLTLEVDAEFMRLFEETKAIVGAHRMADVFQKTMKEYLKRKSPIQRSKRRVERIKQPTRSRHIPLKIRDQVHCRDGGRCSFVGMDGKRCNETKSLHLDHILPFAYGGEHAEENLRLVCPAHNRLLAERIFGKDKIPKHQGDHRHGGGALIR